jgi:hypothetical protein
MLYDIPIIDYNTADPATKRYLKMMMWLRRYGEYDSTTPYIASA